MGLLKLIRVGAVVLAGVLAVKLLRQAGTRSQERQDAARKGRKFVKSKVKDSESD